MVLIAFATSFHNLFARTKATLPAVAVSYTSTMSKSGEDFHPPDGRPWSGRHIPIVHTIFTYFFKKKRMLIFGTPNWLEHRADPDQLRSHYDGLFSDYEAIGGRMSLGHRFRRNQG